MLGGSRDSALPLQVGHYAAEAGDAVQMEKKTRKKKQISPVGFSAEDITFA